MYEQISTDLILCILLELIYFYFTHIQDQDVFHWCLGNGVIAIHN